MVPLLRRYTHSVRWSPWTIPQSVRCLWLSAQDHGTGLMTDDGAGLISSWSSRGTTGQVFTAPADTTRPTWSATGLGGLYRALVGDGVNDCLTMASTLGLPTGSAPSVVMALASGAGPVAGRLFEYGFTSATQGRRFQSGTANEVLLSNAGTSVNAGNTPPVRTWNAPVIAIGSWATDLALRGRVDGGSNIGAATMVALATASTRSRIFANSAASAGNFGSYALSELVALSGDISTLLATIQKIEGYWAWAPEARGGYPALNLAAAFPADHPYKGGPP